MAKQENFQNLFTFLHLYANIEVEKDCFALRKEGQSGTKTKSSLFVQGIDKETSQCCGR
jgi:hypothetical protein